MSRKGDFSQRALNQDESEKAAGILIDSRTVVEKDDFVSTGILTFAQGDIIEIEINEHLLYSLGDIVKLTIYSIGGIYTVKTTVVARDQGTIIVLNPPENQKQFLGKREHPRVNTVNSGLIKTMLQTKVSDSHIYEEPVQISLENISINGMGLKVKAEQTEVDLRIGCQMEVEINLGFPMECKIEVVQMQDTIEGFYYGVKIIDLPIDKKNPLRAFILKLQVEQRFENRSIQVRSKLKDRR